MQLLRLLVLTLAFPLMSSAYEQAFPKTGVGTFEIKTLPAARLIASQADTGYFQEAEGALRKWLADQNQYEPTGEARGVFWDAPYVPWFLKRFEVHIPVKAKGQD